MGFPLSSVYASSKFALEGFSESIAYELEPFGIRVIVIEPGVIRTNFGDNFKIGKNISFYRNHHNSSYSEITERRIAGFKPRFEAGSSPRIVAEAILECITTDNQDLRHLVGDDAYSLLNKKKNTSDREFRDLVMKSVIK
jgi:NAD(P)-dependent dehydrogenase (short-subunit alcohol dehydrogenase family)